MELRQAKGPQRYFSTSRIVLLVLAFVTALTGWSMYSEFVAPQWMRSFGLELAAKAKVTSTKPSSTVFSTMKNRPEPESPYICFAEIAPFLWDRVHFFVPGGSNTHSLDELVWEGRDSELAKSRLRNGEQYQLIVFSLGDTVVDYGYYYTIWANLSALDEIGGYQEQEAVFVAESDGEIYHVFEASHAQHWPNAKLVLDGICDD